MRLGGAWLLTDVATGRVLRAGRERLPNTGDEDDYSTRAEGITIARAYEDVNIGVAPAGRGCRCTLTQRRGRRRGYGPRAALPGDAVQFGRLAQG